MNKFVYTIISITTFIVLFSCVSHTKEKIPVAVKETPIVEKIEETPPVEEEKYSSEYERSLSTLQEEAVISQDDFEADKAAILEIISKLDTVMREQDFERWQKYVLTESLVYWSNTRNLAEVSKKLPVKGFQLKSLNQYFRYIFIPARLGREVTEIRYISPTYVKAVQVSDNQDIIYYSFNKYDGRWYVNLEKL